MRDTDCQYVIDAIRPYVLAQRSDTTLIMLVLQVQMDSYGILIRPMDQNEFLKFLHPDVSTFRHHHQEK